MTVRVQDDVPEWLGKLAALRAEQLGLHDWDIELCMADKPMGNPDWGGSCETVVRAQYSLISIKRDRSEAETTTTILHEMLHAALARIDVQVGKRIIDGLVPKPLRKHAHALFADANEQTVVNLTRALEKVLPDADAGTG